MLGSVIGGQLPGLPRRSIVPTPSAGNIPGPSLPYGYNPVTGTVGATGEPGTISMDYMAQQLRGQIGAAENVGTYNPSGLFVWPDWMKSLGSYKWLLIGGGAVALYLILSKGR